MKARVGFLVLACLLASSFTTARASVIVPGCADASAAGGEWRSYGGLPSNMRNQPQENVINSSSVANLGLAWSFNPQAAEYIDPESGLRRDLIDGGSFDNTPVIADGCVFLATTSGWVIAINAQGGAPVNPETALQRVVWATHFDNSGSLSLRSSAITGSPVVANGVVYVGVTNPSKKGVKGPYVAALDEATGRTLWEQVVEIDQDNAGIAASPVFIPPSPSAPNGMIFQGFYGSEGLLPNTAHPGDPTPQLPARGGYAFVDAGASCEAANFAPPSHCYNVQVGAQGGRMIHHEYTITNAEYAQGYRGASVWCTAAYDPDTKHLYACGGNPADARLEARYANALLKIDADSSNATFGRIVDAYKGTTDQYYPGTNNQAACDTVGDRVVVLWSQPCGQLDLDFGSSPQLFKMKIGAGTTFETRTLVGDLQKAGIYHAVWADNMQSAWQALIAPPGPTSNASSPALDLKADGTINQIYVNGTPPGDLVALGGTTGRYAWAMPFGEGTHFQSVTTANGVVYGIDNAGTLGMFDAATGLPLARRPLQLDVNDNTAATGSSGIAIARHSVYVNASNFLVVLR